MLVNDTSGLCLRYVHLDVLVLERPLVSPSWRFRLSHCGTSFRREVPYTVLFVCVLCRVGIDVLFFLLLVTILALGLQSVVTSLGY